MAKTKYMEFKKFDVMSAAKLASLFGVIIGLFAGIMVALGAVTGVLTINSFATTANFGIAAILLFPIIYGIVYFICGAIATIIYNLIAGKIGGLKVLVK